MIPDRPARAPLSIAVVGAGGIGSVFAFMLAKAGHAVTLHARPGSSRLTGLEAEEGIVRTDGDRATMRVAGALDENAPYDLVIVTVLDHQVEPLLPGLARSRARAVQFMFNTAAPERLVAAVGEERASLGMPMVMARLDADGRLDAAIPKGRRTLHGDRRWAALFEAAGLPSAFEPQMDLWLRCHAPMCAALESIALAAKRRGGGASWGEALGRAKGAQAGFAVIRARGLRIHPPAKARLAGLPAPALAGMFWALSRVRAFRELLATGEGECRAMSAALAADALAVGPGFAAEAAALRALGAGATT